MDERRKGLSDDEIERIAAALSLKMQATSGCQLTEEQQQAVVELISQKKKIVKTTLYLIGALVLWALKDVYLYVADHITWGR